MEDKITNTPSENEYRNFNNDGKIEIDTTPKDSDYAEPLPESARPRKDGPGGD